MASGSAPLLKAFRKLDRALACNLLEVEVLSALRREKIPFAEVTPFFQTLDWVFPDQNLGVFSRRVLEQGYVRGGDAYHLASALWALGETYQQAFFLTLDQAQNKVAAELGFLTNLKKLI